MAAIFEPVTIGWDGKEYKIKMSFEIVCHLDSEVPIAVMAHQAAIGQPRVTQIAKAVAILLSHAGVEVTDEQAYVELMGAGEQAMLNIVAAVVTAAFPSQKGGKQGNVKAPAKAKKPQK